MTLRVEENPKCQKCGYLDAKGASVCRQSSNDPNFCAVRWQVVDDDCPKTSEFSYGLVAYGFDSREEAIEFIKLYE